MTLSKSCQSWFASEVYLYLHLEEEPVPIGHVLFGNNLSDDLQSQASPCCLMPKSKETVLRLKRKLLPHLFKVFFIEKRL